MKLDWEITEEKIKDVIIKSLISAEPHIVNSTNRASKYKNNFFELYGFDILLDSTLKPWLLEINISPSLNSSSPLDKKIKTMLLSDIFNTIGIVPYDKKIYEKEQEDMKLQKFLGLKTQTTITESS